MDLPVRQILPELFDVLKHHSGAVLAAAPGAGKTTLVPPALLDHMAERIILLEPRRVAVRAAARRIAQYTPERVGYIVRGENRSAPNDRITVMTEGVLLRLLRDDPDLPGVGLIIFDEFHERSLDADLALALSLDARKVFRPDLKLLIMSATLETEKASALLGGVPVIDAPGRVFPVDVRYGESVDRFRPAPGIARAIGRIFGESEGDVLVFLPGMREIDECAELLSLPDALVLKLHGSLSPAEQDGCLLPAPPGKRKIILSTNVAESSITIDGVAAVVDSGLERRLRFDPAAGISFLETQTISLASAAQRSGRAGRTRPGVALRLWNRLDERGRPERTMPEILEADLAGFALETAAWGTAAEELSWIDPPPAPRLAAARTLLLELGALDEKGGLAPRGKELSQLPVHPRLGAMLLEAKKHRLLPLGCEIAAILEERDAFRAFGNADLRERILRMRSRPNEFRNQLVIKKQLLDLLRVRDEQCDVEKAGFLAACAFPDWIGRARKVHGTEYILSGGAGGRLADGDDLCKHEFLAVARLDGSAGPSSMIRLAAPVELDELGDRARETVKVEFDPEKERVYARREKRFGAILLSSTPLENPPDELIAQALLEAAFARNFEIPSPLYRRVAYAHEKEPERYPDWTNQFAPPLGKVRTFADLKKLDWTTILKGMLSFETLRQLEADYPEAFVTPAGARHRIDYTGDVPALAAKVQEFYGVKIHPTVGRRKIPLKIELLSPALRPVQTTSDLPGFWRGNWPLLQKEMRARYPKHLWPDNPAESAPMLRSIKT